MKISHSLFSPLIWSQNLEPWLSSAFLEKWKQGVVPYIAKKNTWMFVSRPKLYKVSQTFVLKCVFNTSLFNSDPWLLDVSLLHGWVTQMAQHQTDEKQCDLKQWLTQVTEVQQIADKKNIQTFTGHLLVERLCPMHEKLIFKDICPVNQNVYITKKFSIHLCTYHEHLRFTVRLCIDSQTVWCMNICKWQE